MGAAHPIGVVLVAVLIWPNLSLGTFMPVRPPSVTSNNGVYFGNGGGGVGVGSIATDGFHSGAPIGGPVGSGAGSIVFPGPNDRRAAFFGLLKLPYIICYYAAHGRWPNFPSHLQAAVLDLGRHVFAMDDYGLRNYCSKFFRFTIGHRPCCSTSVYPIAILPGGVGPGTIGFDQVPGKKPAKRTTKKPIPAPDAEFIPEVEPEGGAGEDTETEEPVPAEEEPAPEGGGEDYDTGRLVNHQRQKERRGSECREDGVDCGTKTVPFVPLRNGKDAKQLDKNKTGARKLTSDGRLGSTGIPK
nr:LOW QUALITY PROTEIN: uncharacterized protein LOC109419646 [Aedes albopictus]